MAKEAGIIQHPLFIDYGQLSRNFEWVACRRICRRFDLPTPVRIDVSGFGKTISAGITSRAMRLVEDAFLPSRNLLFVVLAGAFAYKLNADGVCIGLLTERDHIFPDQTRHFLNSAQAILQEAMDCDIKIVAPLIELSKVEVLRLAAVKGIRSAYSCHRGLRRRCQKCISCREYLRATEKG